MSNNISKHQQANKHRLKDDIIFKGRKEKLDDETDSYINTFQDNFQYDPASIYSDEAYNNAEYQRSKKVKERIHEIIVNKTDINLEASRRKPSKADFNKYFVLIKNETRDDNFTNVEIFNELAVYFSENLFNIFKLLDNQWRNLIINELQKHIGKVPEETKEITIKNLKPKSEVEFKYYDELEDINKLITGVIISYDESDKLFKIDSFEKIYLVKIEDITKILNNNKSRYNLNKLNNIDFL
jgi:hypothetical protein